MRLLRIAVGKVLMFGMGAFGGGSTPPIPSGTFLATEALDDIVTEAGDNLVTE